jgi:hypothetical protein
LKFAWFETFLGPSRKEFLRNSLKQALTDHIRRWSSWFQQICSVLEFHRIVADALVALHQVAIPFPALLFSEILAIEAIEPVLESLPRIDAVLMVFGDS